MAAGDKTTGRRLPTVDVMTTRGDYVPVLNDAGDVTALWFILPVDVEEESRLGWGRIAARGHGKEDEDEWDIELDGDLVTVSPSIRQDPVAPGVSGWHGYLENGVWREV